VVKTLQAIYENGVLKPVEPIVGLPDHAEVTITVDTSTPSRPLDDWRGGLSDEDAAEMRKIIDEEFGQVNPDDWK
jgi:predicted DNA-binding antitoxin AbrB/MazE fold protein